VTKELVADASPGSHWLRTLLRILGALVIVAAGVGLALGLIGVYALPVSVSSAVNPYHGLIVILAFVLIIGGLIVVAWELINLIRSAMGRVPWSVRVRFHWPITLDSLRRNPQPPTEAPTPPPISSDDLHVAQMLSAFTGDLDPSDGAPHRAVYAHIVQIALNAQIRIDVTELRTIVDNLYWAIEQRDPPPELFRVEEPVAPDRWPLLLQMSAHGSLVRPNRDEAEILNRWLRNLMMDTRSLPSVRGFYSRQIEQHMSDVTIEPQIVGNTVRLSISTTERADCHAAVVDVSGPWGPLPPRPFPLGWFGNGVQCAVQGNGTALLDLCDCDGMGNLGKTRGRDTQMGVVTLLGGGVPAHRMWFQLQKGGTQEFERLYASSLGITVAVTAVHPDIAGVQSITSRRIDITFPNRLGAVAGQIAFTAAIG
jgi:hypothetical protein